MKLLFCGTPDFAVPTLKRLIESPFRPQMVFTQPDRPRGRGQKVTPCPVKTIAVDAGLPLFQPEKFNQETTWNILDESQFDLAIVVAYSAKIGRRALQSVPKGWLNLHPSLLPKYRGAAPMQWAIMEGETDTGISTFFLNEEWDAGPICLQEKFEIETGENYGSLSVRCAEKGAELILNSIELISQGIEKRTPQDDSQATFARLLKKEDLAINWNRPAEVLQNQIRGLNPRPGARTLWDKGMIRIQEATSLGDNDSTSPPGVLLRVGVEGIDVQTGHGVLRILKLQPENKKPMRIKEFLNGYEVKPGTEWGSERT